MMTSRLFPWAVQSEVAGNLKSIAILAQPALDWAHTSQHFLLMVALEIFSAVIALDYHGDSRAYLFIVLSNLKQDVYCFITLAKEKKKGEKEKNTEFWDWICF